MFTLDSPWISEIIEDIVIVVLDGVNDVGVGVVDVHDGQVDVGDPESESVPISCSAFTVLATDRTLHGGHKRRLSIHNRITQGHALHIVQILTIILNMRKRYNTS